MKQSEKLEQFLLIKLFQNYVRQMKNEKRCQQVRMRFLNSSNKILVTKNLILEQYHYLLKEEEAFFLYQCFHSFFVKRNERQKNDSNVRESLLKKQHHKCNICYQPISFFNSELDHIIPWYLVGDELNNNLQMLCISCNRKKNKFILLPISNTVLY